MSNTNSTGHNTLINNNNKSLKIILNARSIKGKAKRHSLEIFLNEHKPDALLLSETHLTHTDNPKIKDYNIIRTDKKKGGTIT